MSHLLRSPWLIGIALFTLAGVLFGTQFYFSSAQMGGTSPHALFIYDQLVYWYTWGVIFPLILLLERRFPVERTPRVRALALHALAGIAAAYLHAALYLTAIHLLGDSLGYALTDRSWSEGFVRLNMPMRVVNYYLFVAGIAVVAVSQRVVERTVAASRLEAELALARERALRAQMRPHFLFNALNAVSGLVRSGDGQRAVSMIAGLSELLRASLSYGEEQLVSLEEEIAFARQYLAVEQVRFADRLSVLLDVDNEVTGARVPSFLLQPLVENAILHGIARRPGKGELRIAAARRGSELILTVGDDGAGLPDGWDRTRDAGIGLRNTAERLHHLYQELGRLDVAPAERGGTVATVTIPFTTSVRSQG